MHGSRVLVVDGPSGPREDEADAIVTTSPAACVAVLGADCALVGLASAEGVVGVAHAGWRGLVAGVLPQAVATMRSLGASSIVAALGPCIGPECYAFGPAELDLVASVLGDVVRSTTAIHRPALDVAAGVRTSLERVDVPVVVELGGCTSCDDRWYSYRARRETSRHALVLVRDGGTSGA